MLRTCKKCGVDKDITLFKKDSRSKLGYTSCCKECSNNDSKLRRRDNNKLKREIRLQKLSLITSIVCSKCELEKDLSHYTINKLKRKYKYVCIECNKEYRYNHAKENPDKVRLRSRRYRVKNRERLLVKERKIYNEKKDTIEFKTIRTNSYNKRRCLEKQFDSDITTNWLRELWDKTTHCEITGLKLENHGKYPYGKNLDHIIPLCIGGSHTKDNVRFISSIANFERPKDGRDVIIPALLFINNILELQKRVKRRP